METDSKVFSKKQLAILQVAESLFIEKGYNQVSIKEIATGAGINSAQVFYYFITKENLLEQMLEWRIHQLLEKIDAVVSDKALPIQTRLVLLIEQYVELGFANPLVLAQLFYENAISEHAGTRELLSNFKERNSIIIAGVIQAGQEQGVVKKTASVELITGLIVGTITYMVINRDDYREIMQQRQLDEEAGREELKRILAGYLKGILQSILIYE
ncbi:transcriptional regulator, TetR family [Filimonas lacunae]|uniref:Transcriptional regulator, TetR family n=1 Tax=Filimonas lacunae TaxID=477680 RepID=A0A173MNR1_9BACT|nr:TetR/AcrR family transcriptional regulator [Filimonas lacunae]BAV09283.1 transcriptional regulator, TetR family [Filimonas lacunae]SIS70435.1 transcriptional regulator, TetR family [Filimonas lacunae]